MRVFYIHACRHATAGKFRIMPGMRTTSGQYRTGEDNETTTT